MENKEQWQYVYLFMDDSGKISHFEDYSVFAGIIFSSSEEIGKFKNGFKSILSELFPKYNLQISKDELKGSFINNSHRRRIMNFSKKFITFGTVIFNQNLRKNIIEDKKTKGRFIEYAQRRVIKDCISYLIGTNVLDAYSPIKIIISIDEMPTKTNGYYCLQDGLKEELKYGIINYNYGKTFPPIVHSDLEVHVHYKNSKLSLGIQMADIIANTIRKSLVLNPNWFETSVYLKEKNGLKILLKLPN